jgi:Protein of unknown function (DUF2845)
MKHPCSLLLMLFLPLLANADSIRCGSRIIQRGSSSAELTAFCGEPAAVARPSSYLDQIEVEIRTYNFGPNQLMERVRIENGVIVQIDSLGYGYNEP